MGTVSDLVGRTKPAGELLVEVAGAVYAEVVHPQAFGVGVGPGNPGIFYAAGKVKVSAQRMLAQASSGEPAPGALERDRAFGDGVGKRAACLRQLDEPVIQRDDFGWLTEQVALNRPLLVHLVQATSVSAGPSWSLWLERLGIDRPDTRITVGEQQERQLQAAPAPVAGQHLRLAQNVGIEGYGGRHD